MFYFFATRKMRCIISLLQKNAMFYFFAAKNEKLYFFATEKNAMFYFFAETVLFFNLFETKLSRCAELTFLK